MLSYYPPALYIAGWIMANAVAVGVFDLWAYFFAGPDQSVSYWLQRWMGEWPMLAFFGGILAGHLCWPLHRGDK